MLLKTQTTILFFITLTISAFSQTWKIHDKVQVKYGNTQYYNAEIIDVKGPVPSKQIALIAKT